jgi:hypothetical protein
MQSGIIMIDITYWFSLSWTGIWFLDIHSILMVVILNIFSLAARTLPGWSLRPGFDTSTRHTDARSSFQQLQLMWESRPKQSSTCGMLLGKLTHYLAGDATVTKKRD